MLPWLRYRYVQRIIVALVVSVFVPLAVTAHACQTMRHLAFADLRPTAFHTAQDSAGPGRLDESPQPLGRQPVDVLTHLGPCHLLATAAMPEDTYLVTLPEPTVHWPRIDASHFVSCSWPPPKHPPRLR